MRTYDIARSALTAVGWDTRSGILELTFEAGDVYRSSKPVEADLVAHLLFAKSPCTFFLKHLRGRFGFDKVSDHRPVVSPSQCVPCPKCRPNQNSRSQEPCDLCLSLRMVPASEAEAFTAHLP